MLRLPTYDYHRPASIAEALGLLGEHVGDAMPIAGGTDLVPNMKHKLFTPGHLVALGAVPELRGIEVRSVADPANGEAEAVLLGIEGAEAALPGFEGAEAALPGFEGAEAALPGFEGANGHRGSGDRSGRYLRIGASETLSSVAAHPEVRGWLPALADAAGQVAGPQLRNRGTIGGNLCLDTRCTYYNQTHFWRSALGYCLKKDGDVCHVTKVGKKCVAAQSADTPPVLATLGALAVLRSPSGERVVPVADFFVADGIANTVRTPDELVVEIRVPLPSSRVRMAYRKLRQRNAIDFPLLNVAAAAEFAEDGSVEDLRIVVSALGSRQRVLSGVDRIAVGHPLSEEVIDAVAERAHAQCHPLTNIIVDPDWRRAMVPVHVRRALEGLVPAPLAA